MYSEHLPNYSTPLRLFHHCGHCVVLPDKTEQLKGQMKCCTEKGVFLAELQGWSLQRVGVRRPDRLRKRLISTRYTGLILDAVGNIGWADRGRTKVRTADTSCVESVG